MCRYRHFFRSGLRRCWRPPLAAVRGDEASAKARLASKGIRVTHSGLSLTDEAELAKEFREAATLKRKLLTAVREFNATQRGVDELTANLHERMQANVAINGQLANSGQANFIATQPTRRGRQRQCQRHQPADAGAGAVEEGSRQSPRGGQLGP